MGDPSSEEEDEEWEESEDVEEEDMEEEEEEPLETRTRLYSNFSSSSLKTQSPSFLKPSTPPLPFRS